MEPNPNRLLPRCKMSHWVRGKVRGSMERKEGKKPRLLTSCRRLQSKISLFTSQLQVDALVIGLFRAQCHSYLMWSDIMYIANVTNVLFCTVDKQLAHPNSWSFIMLKKYSRASYVSQGLVKTNPELKVYIIDYI